jgi:hypothetical protein
MICCDWCEIWYHGECVGGITATDSKRIEKFCCPSCREKSPGLKTVYKSGYKKHHDKDKAQGAGAGFFKPLNNPHF